MTKEKLRSYTYLAREVRQLYERVECTREEMYTVKSVVIDDMPKGTTKSDKLANIVAKYEQEESLYLELLDKLLCVLHEIEQVIMCLDSSTERQMMRKRYIENKRWEDICFEMGYSWRQLHYIHSKVLRKLNIA